MGYTHSITLDDVVSRSVDYDRAVALLARDLWALLEDGAFSFELAGPNGKGAPILDPDAPLVAFNGPDPDGSYESVYFPSAEVLLKERERRVASGWYSRKDPSWTFWVKTGFARSERRPYDLAVRVAMALLRWHFGGGALASGDAPLTDWYEATRLIESRLGYPVDPFYVTGRELAEVGPFLVECARTGESHEMQVRVKDVLEGWLRSRSLDPALRRALQQAILSPVRIVKRVPGRPIREGAPVYWKR